MVDSTDRRGMGGAPGRRAAGSSRAAAGRSHRRSLRWSKNGALRLTGP